MFSNIHPDHYTSPAMRELHREVEKLLKKIDGPYDERHLSSCGMYLGLLANHVISNSVQMDARQAYQVAHCIVVRVDEVLHNQARPFTSMEVMQIATFINTCQPRV